MRVPGGVLNKLQIFYAAVLRWSLWSQVRVAVNCKFLRLFITWLNAKTGSKAHLHGIGTCEWNADLWCGTNVSFFLWNVWHEPACLDALNPCVLCHTYVLQGTNYKSLLYNRTLPPWYIYFVHALSSPLWINDFALDEYMSSIDFYLIITAWWWRCARLPSILNSRSSQVACSHKSICIYGRW